MTGLPVTEMVVVIVVAVVEIVAAAVMIVAVMVVVVMVGVIVMEVGAVSETMVTAAARHGAGVGRNAADDGSKQKYARLLQKHRIADAVCPGIEIDIAIILRRRRKGDRRQTKKLRNG